MARLCSIVLAALVFGCGAHQQSVIAKRADRIDAGNDNKLANLERAARYPWKDDGRCAVQESSGDWATLVERCYGALDLRRIQFVDSKGVCPIAQAGAVSADELTQLVGVCLLIQPEIAVGAVIIIGAVVVAAAISAEIEAAERAKKSKKKWCDCYCGSDSVPVLRNTLDFECRSECVFRGHAPTDYICR